MKIFSYLSLKEISNLWVYIGKRQLSIQEESLEKQKQLMEDAFESWRGSNEQIDDVCVVGLRV